MSDESIILRRFPTERFKRFWFPTRPLLTLGLGLGVFTLGWLGIIPLGWSLWAAAGFAFDDLPIMPILSIVTAFNNYAEGRKQFKAIVMLTIATVALILGGVFGWYALANMPIFIQFISNYVAATACSPFLISTLGILGGFLAYTTKKTSPLVGFLLGITFAPFIPFAMPLAVEVVFICMAMSTFVASILAKQGLRIYYHYRYGHSNADGYEMARNAQEQQEFIAKQAKRFNVSAAQFDHVTQQCRDKIADLKQKASFWDELNNERHYRTKTYKDMYHVLMNPILTDEDVIEAKALIGVTLQKPYLDDIDNRTLVGGMLVFGFLSNPNLEIRNRVHQLKMKDGGDFNDNLLSPFVTP